MWNEDVATAATLPSGKITSALATPKRCPRWNTEARTAMSGPSAVTGR